MGDLVMPVLTVILSLVAIMFIVWKYIASRKVEIFASSKLSIVNKSNAVAKISVLNESQRSIEIQAVRFNICVWDETPKIKVHGFLKFLRLRDLLFEHDGTWYYPSDAAWTD